MSKELTNQEILEKAIQKASSSGWQPTSVGMVTIIAAGWMQHDQYKGIIFNHDFAQTLWPGEDKPGSFKRGNIKIRQFAPWKYHLQKMVIADDPIKYLGENI